MTDMSEPKRKTKLSDPQKAFVVQRLACWDSPAEVSDALMREHGVKLAPQNCEAYDPTKYAGRNLSAKWRELFERTRGDFLANVEAIPEANRAVRIRALAHASRAFKARGDYRAQADMLERIAKEMGDVYSNRREVTGKNGGPLRLEVSDLTDAQLDARLMQLIGVAGLSDGTEEEGEGRGRSTRH